MATRHASARKRHRQNVKRQARNQAVRTRMRHAIRHVREAVASKDPDAARAGLRAAMKVIATAASKGVVHPGTASRYIARLSKHVAPLTG